jgi:O-methyltransferase
MDKRRKAKSRTFKGMVAGVVNGVLLRTFGIAICRLMLSIGRKREEYIYTASDYVRCSSLELVAHEVYAKDIKGNVAELGVFRGDFAKFINISFPDRKLYLFDTFEGFNDKDREIEKKGNYSQDKQDFSNTSVELVLNKMQYKENCVVRKGYFPETAKDLEDEFVFVSIDADLYEPTYNGLNYFYPRLKRGGYIFYPRLQR